MAAARCLALCALVASGRLPARGEHCANYPYLRARSVFSVAEGPAGGAAHSFVLAGASGDLARREIYPALWRLFRDDLLPRATAVFGYARTELTLEQLRASCEPHMRVKPGEEARHEEFWRLNHYVAGSYTREADFAELERRLERHERGAAQANRLFYLALPPSVFEPVAGHIRRACSGQSGWTRLVVEKPFGRDAESSRRLSDHLARLFREEQLYRMDHYLGEEAVQGLLALRFGNRVLGPSWNREHVASVLLDFRENLGVEARGGYFDGTGIIRDVAQNHLLQVLALLAMEEPASLGPDDVRDAKVALLRSVSPPPAGDLLVGQYVGEPGSAEPRARLGYRQDPTVPDDSLTPTFCLLVLRLENERWRGVPFLVRAGKGLDANGTEVIVQYREAGSGLFERRGDAARNELVLGIGRAGGLRLRLTARRPGLADRLEELVLAADRGSADGPSAHARLILDAFRGSQANFVRSDELSEAWRIFTPILHELEANRTRPIPYTFGSTGPSEADDMEKKNNFLRKSP